MLTIIEKEGGGVHEDEMFRKLEEPEQGPGTSPG